MASLIGVRTAFVMFLALVLQVCLFARTPVFGVTPEVVLLTTIGIALIGGPERGAIAGFVGGFVFDCTVTTPFGMSALVYASVGYVVGGLQYAVLGSTWYTPLFVAGIASALGTLAYGILGGLAGNFDWLTPRLVLVAFIVGLLNTGLAVVGLPITRWSQGEPLGLSALKVPEFLTRRRYRNRRAVRTRRHRPQRGGW